MMDSVASDPSLSPSPTQSVETRPSPPSPSPPLRWYRDARLFGTVAMLGSMSISEVLLRPATPAWPVVTPTFWAGVGAALLFLVLRAWFDRRRFRTSAWVFIGRDSVFRAFGWTCALIAGEWVASRVDGFLAVRLHHSVLLTFVTPLTAILAATAGLLVGVSAHLLPDRLQRAWSEGRISHACGTDLLWMGAAWGVSLAASLSVSHMADGGTDHLYLIAAALPMFALVRWAQDRLQAGRARASAADDARYAPPVAGLWVVMDRPAARLDFAWLDRAVHAWTRHSNAPVTVVLPQSAPWRGEQVHAATRLERLEALFPRYAIELEDWLRLQPDADTGASSGVRILFPAWPLLPEAVASLRQADDIVLLAADATVDAARWQGVLPRASTRAMRSADVTGRHFAGYEMLDEQRILSAAPPDWFAAQPELAAAQASPFSKLSATSGRATPRSETGQARFARSQGLLAATIMLLVWYDFFLFGSLSPYINKEFFDTQSYAGRSFAIVFTFAASFFMRPFGALVCGHFADRFGRKRIVLVTAWVAAATTLVVACLPGVATLGTGATFVLVAMRLLQGMALGGAWSIAAVLAVEQSPSGRRGEFTAWLQATPALAAALTFTVTGACRALFSPFELSDLAWRFPFFASLVLIVVAALAARRLAESVVFEFPVPQRQSSTSPLIESFGQRANVGRMLAAAFGLTAGQIVTWYGGLFYPQVFLTVGLKVTGDSALSMTVAAIVLSAPAYPFFGRLSDRFGRRPIVFTAMALAALAYFPIYGALARVANPELSTAQASTVVLRVDPSTCSVLANPLSAADPVTPCDIARRYLVQSSASFLLVPDTTGTPTLTASNSVSIAVPAGTLVASTGQLEPASAKEVNAFKSQVSTALHEAGYPAKAAPIAFMSGTWWAIVGLVWVLMVLGAMAFAPGAAFIVELFPSRIAATSIALPGTGCSSWIGGLLPLSATALATTAGNMTSGLWYPVIVAGAAFILGWWLLPETRGIVLQVQDPSRDAVQPPPLSRAPARGQGKRPLAQRARK